MNEPTGYATPAAFRRALTDRLKALASGSRWPLPQLQRQIAYDRLLERLYLADDQWIVKGATALLARNLGVRATIDVDLYRPQAAQTAEAQLRAAAQHDIGDWFRFEIGPAQPVTAGTTSRLPVTAIVGATVWVSFHIDLAGEDLRMTGRPDDVPPLARVLMPGIQQHGYRAYPLVDHIADKLAAMFERHGTLRAPSTRYKDLVDLVAILTKISVQADAQRRRWNPKPSDAVSSCLASSTFPTTKCGTPATAQKHGVRSSPSPAPCTRRPASCGPSQTHSFSGPPPATGNPPPAGGPGNPIYPAATRYSKFPGPTVRSSVRMTGRGSS